MTQVPGYRSFGGVHPDTAALKNLLAHADVRAPHTGKPFTEAAILGIAGGIGSGYSFCPSVLRYGMGAGVGLVSRHLAYTFDGTFHKAFLDRVGIERTILEASSPSAGQKKAAAALEKGSPVLVWCTRMLSYHGGVHTPALTGGAAWAVVVHGIDEAKGEAEVADLAPASLPATLESLGKARSAVCTHKNRLLTVGAPKSIPRDRLGKAMLEGIRSCVEAQTKPRIKTFSLQ
ncbi:MAG: BtrH N-terminal domain-containing protein, partial [Planctomycetota bacterium]